MTPGHLEETSVKSVSGRKNVPVGLGFAKPLSVPPFLQAGGTRGVFHQQVCPPGVDEDAQSPAGQPICMPP